MEKSWIQLSQQDEKYTIKTIYSNGDCFFECLKYSLLSHPKYKDKENTITILKLRQLVSNLITQDIFEIYKTMFNEAIKERNYETIVNFGFMKNVQSLNQLRNVVKTNIVWANETMISLLEKALRIKFIIFSERKFRLKQWPYIETAEIIDETIHPIWYILLSFDGGHYNLVGYDNKYLFSVEELPCFLKVDILTHIPLFRQKVVGWDNLKVLAKSADF